MEKILDALKVIGGILWVLALLLFHIGIAASCGSDGSNMLTGLILILIWWIFTVGTYTIYGKISSANRHVHGVIRKRPPVGKAALAVRAVLYVFWMLILVFIHIGFLGAFSLEENVWLWVIPAAVWWAVTIVTHLVTSRRKARIEAEEKAAYDAVYITEFTIEDELLGKMKLRADSCEKELEAVELHLPPFGADSPETLEVVEYDENDREKIFNAVREVYIHKDEILDYICPEYAETLIDYEETDENGEPYTPEKIREVMAVCFITVCNFENRFCVDLEMTVTGGGTSEMGGHGFIASVNFTDRSINFDMPG